MNHLREGIIMSEKERIQIERAHAFAKEKHEGQTRIGGKPYISHPEAVAEIVRRQDYGVEYQITALFHDLLEDTDASEEEILELGGPEVLTAVKLLTKPKGYVMKEYVAGIRGNQMAFVVKGADRLHNLQSAFCTDEKFKHRYILETIDWYWDFMPEIPGVVKKLAMSMEKPLKDMEFIYTPVEGWKI